MPQTLRAQYCCCCCFDRIIRAFCLIFLPVAGSGEKSVAGSGEKSAGNKMFIWEKRGRAGLSCLHGRSTSTTQLTSP